MAILNCENLSFAYDGRTVLEDVNFSLNAGDYLCVVGENGSGKSTLIKGLLGLDASLFGSLQIIADGGLTLDEDTVEQRPAELAKDNQQNDEGDKHGDGFRRIGENCFHICLLFFLLILR